MWLDPHRYEIMDDAMADVLRNKTAGERLNMVNSMCRTARNLIRDKLRQDFPHWTEAEINRETARRMSRGAF